MKKPSFLLMLCLMATSLQASKYNVMKNKNAVYAEIAGFPTMSVMSVVYDRRINKSFVIKAGIGFVPYFFNIEDVVLHGKKTLLLPKTGMVMPTFTFGKSPHQGEIGIGYSMFYGRLTDETKRFTLHGFPMLFGYRYEHDHWLLRLSLTMPNMQGTVHISDTTEKKMHPSFIPLPSISFGVRF